MVLKGKISTVLNGGSAVTVAPYGGGVVTAPLTVPLDLRGMLPVNTPVMYAKFEDNTGVILGRIDGVSGGGGFSVSSDGDAVVIKMI